jgi:predicted DNA-binding transcriptional regulator YafY
LAFDEEKAKIKTFGLDRIVHLERSERHFQLSPNFKPSDYFKYSYGITYSEQAPMEVHLSFYGPSCHYVLTKPLHPSQQIISQSPDSLEVKLKVLHSYELLADILSFGDACQVLGPSQLKKEVKTILEKALRKY